MLQAMAGVYTVFQASTVYDMHVHLNLDERTKDLLTLETIRFDSISLHQNFNITFSFPSRTKRK